MIIKKGSPESFYEQIKQRVLDQITSGKYKTDEQIPSERELCKLYSVSRTTIRKAIDELVVDGILTRKSGRGTFVTDKSLQKKKSNILFIRCVHSDISKSTSEVKDDIFYPKILAGIEITASNNNYHCFFKMINENNFNEKEVEKAVNNSDGIVCGELHNSSFLNYLKKSSKPIVLICPSVRDSDFDTVEIDNFNGATHAVNYLIKNGHENIAFIGGSDESVSSKDRKEGYLRALKENDIEINNSNIFTRGWRLEDGYIAVLTLLKNQKKPTAIFAASDLLAIGTINAIKDFGLKVPDDISVLGFDDIDMASQIRPALTTMKVRRVEMGEIAARLIFEGIKSLRSFPIRVAVPSVLQVRASVDKR